MMKLMMKLRRAQGLEEETRESAAEEKGMT